MGLVIKTTKTAGNKKPLSNFAEAKSKGAVLTTIIEVKCGLCQSNNGLKEMT